MGQNKDLHIRLTEEDFAMLRQKAEAANMTNSNYIRFLIRGDAKSYPEVRRLLTELKREVNYIGHNIDQLVHRNHAGFYNPEDKKYLMAAMQEIMIVLKKAVQEIGNQ